MTELLLGVMGSVNSLQRSFIEHSNLIEVLWADMCHQERTMNSLVRKIDTSLLQPLQCAAQGRACPPCRAATIQQVDTGYCINAVLSANPRTLHVLIHLWHQKNSSFQQSEVTAIHDDDL